MTKVQIVGKTGHETFENLTPQEAEELIEKIEATEGQRYFILDKNTDTIIKELKLQEDQELVLIPIARGG